MGGRILVFAGVLLVLFAGLGYLTLGDAKMGGVSLFPHLPGVYLPVVKVGGVPVNVIKANTPEERNKGLSGRPSLPPLTGMWFAFETDDLYGIWMKEMQFSIDVIWISKDGDIVDVAPNVSPETYPKIFKPHAPARYVLEVPSGFMEQYNLTASDTVDFSGVVR
ncbi:MAG: DUF192 domain-containing protein [Patescibacteria group bacterium]